MYFGFPTNIIVFLGSLHCSLDNSHAITLSKAFKVNKTVTSLDLAANYIGFPGCKALCSMLATENSTITNLNLAVQGGETFFEEVRNPSENYSITEASASVLGPMLRQNNSLTYLNLAHNYIGKGFGREIAGALEENATLLVLDLKDNTIYGEDCKGLCESLKKNSTLQSLDLHHNFNRHGYYEEDPRIKAYPQTSDYWHDKDLIDIVQY